LRRKYTVEKDYTIEVVESPDWGLIGAGLGAYNEQ
jgi:hypothetical protein